MPSFRVIRLLGWFFPVSLAVLSPLRGQNTYSTPYSFTTLAGSAGPAGSADGTGSAAQFNFPQAAVVDSAGNLFVADSFNQAIRKITPAGVVTTFAGMPGSAAFADGNGSTARFERPTGVAIDRANNLYVADSFNFVIRKITPAGNVTTIAGSPGNLGSTDGNGSAARFYNPTGIAIDSAGNLFVSDTQNQTIRKITPAGDVTTFAGIPGSLGLTNGPGVSAKFNSPRGLAIDSADNIYVPELFNHAIRKITPAGVVTLLAGGTAGSGDGTGTGAHFNQPQGVGVDSAGNVYVADTVNGLIRKVTPAGVVTTVAGSAGLGNSVNGVGAAAHFNSPYGVVFNASGVLYVVEAGGEMIRAGVPPSAGKIPGITVPVLVPAGASTVEARAFADQTGGGVIVGISGSYAVRPTGGAQAIQLPSFTNPQPYNLSYVVRLLANGQPDPAFTSAPGGDGTVNSVVVQTDGKILVGGTFTTFNGVLFRNLARLNADGKSDPTFVLGSGVDAQVNALAVQADGKILVGGVFQNYQGQSRPYLLRLSATGAVDPTFAPALNGAVNTIALQSDGRVVIGGSFTSAGGTARNRIARLLATGALDPGFDPGAGANDDVVALLVQSDGKIVAAGDFTSFAGQSRARIARLLAAGTSDPAFSTSASADKTVLSLALQSDGSLLLGGAFTQVNGVARVRLARLFADGTLDPGFDPGVGPDNDVRALLPRSDGTVFLGGLFDQYQGAAVNQVVVVASTPVTTSFVRAPASITVNTGGTARFVAEATGVGALAYQWFKDGVAIGGATDSTLTLTSASAANQGSYTLQVTSSNGGVVISNAATLTVVGGLASQIINLSVLTSLDAPDATFTLGFVIGGTGTSGAKPLLVRAAGPALAAFGVGNPLADPKLQFFAGSTLAGQNDNWGGDPAISALITLVGAFPYTVAASKDAAFAPANLTTAANSVVVAGVGGATGAVIAEVYDATPVSANTATTPRLLNVSVLKTIPGGSTLTAGFVIRGNTSKTVLVRAIGPTLAGFGVGGPMADPKLTLYQSGAVLATNDNWGGTSALKAAFTVVGAFALDSTTRDAALLLTLTPGSYTAEASSADGTSGAALVEVYEVP
jgi:uncharacterized delta-60 repeat protein